LRLLRTFFFEDKSNFNVGVMMLDVDKSKEVKSLYVIFGMKQIFEKTDIKVFVEVEPKKGRLVRRLADEFALRIVRGFCNFKTFIKQDYYLKTSDFIFIPFAIEESPKSSRR